MEPEIHIPSAHLRPYIRQFWAMSCLVKEPYTQRIIPSGMAELTFYLGKTPKVTGRLNPFNDRFLLSGHTNGFSDLLITDDLSLFSITFHPEGLMAFFRVPASELFNRSLPLCAVSPDLATRLTHSLEDAPDTLSRVAIAEKAFTDLLHREIRKYEHSRMQHTIRIIKSTQGKAPITRLASEACLSRKQLERQFNDLVGVSPKQYLKTIRLQAALFRKATDPSISMAALACDCGYFDQAHLTHDFKTLTGLTPLQYFETCQPYSDFFG